MPPVLRLVEPQPVAYVVLPPNLDDVEALRGVGDRLRACIGANCDEIVVDCKAVRVFSPPAVGWLVSAGQAVRSTGGRLILRKVSAALAAQLNALHTDLPHETPDAA